VADVADVSDVVATNQSASVGTIAIPDDAALREQAWGIFTTASDELFALCCQLCGEASDKEAALELYLEAERAYMYGDATDLAEHYQTMTRNRETKQLSLL
jgi:uncharacterized protein (DUF2225 family)